MEYKKKANINIELSYNTDKDMQDFMGVINVAVAARMYPNVRITITPTEPIDTVEEQVKADTPDRLFKLFEDFMTQQPTKGSTAVAEASGKSLLIAYMTKH